MRNLSELKSENETESSLDNAIIGKWLIDSVGENGNLNITAAVNTEFFFFNKSGNCYMLEKVEKDAKSTFSEATKSDYMGKFKTEDNIVSITSDKGNIIMSFKYHIEDKNMVLNENSGATTPNGNTPTFFVSKAW